MESVEERLRELIAKHSIVGMSKENIKEETNLINDLGYDSVQIMRFLADVEKEFCMEIKDEYLCLEFLGKFINLKNLLLANCSNDALINL